MQDCWKVIMSAAVPAAVLFLSCMGFAAAGGEAVGILEHGQESSRNSLFPAGLPQVVNAYGAPPYVAPPVPENAYRGLYVGAISLA